MKLMDFIFRIEKDEDNKKKKFYLLNIPILQRVKDDKHKRVFLLGIRVYKKSLDKPITQPVEEVKKEPIKLDEKDTSFSEKYTVNDFKKPLVCTSQLCNQEFLGLPLFQYWSNKIMTFWNDYIEQAKKEFPHNMPNGILFHRKLWEFVYIIQALYENGCLEEGKKGLGFGIGVEPLPALFASMGCDILATDLGIESEVAQHWAKANQNAGYDINVLNAFNICPKDLFEARVKYRPLDMSKIPDDLEGYDFNWSSCALEHIGGIESSLEFIVDQLKTLKPGGIAVHTTEFNLSSNEETMTDPNCTILREQDIRRVIDRLEKEGHYVYPLDLRRGQYLADNYVDVPPYYKNNVHLRLKLGDYVTTSVGLIIKKGDK